MCRQLVLTASQSASSFEGATRFHNGRILLHLNHASEGRQRVEVAACCKFKQEHGHACRHASIVEGEAWLGALCLKGWLGACREAGVRTLKKSLEKIHRKVALKLVEAGLLGPSTSERLPDNEGEQRAQEERSGVTADSPEEPSSPASSNQGRPHTMNSRFHLLVTHGMKLSAAGRSQVIKS